MRWQLRRLPFLPPAPPRGQLSEISYHQSEILLVPAPPKQTARAMRPLWRDLILQVWPALRNLGEGWGRRPARMPRGEIQDSKPQSQDTRPNRRWHAAGAESPSLSCLLRLIVLSLRAEGIPDDDPDATAWFHQRPAWKAPVVHLDDDRIRILE